ncbi:hypothetical protein EYF80_019674 [Liparis tanakae]|uniref:Uncharacterized protein n=1 Tax=Liparis tanakae TaxID=230148 RepID=A0A4Z2HYV7_9TELE|nr:hypothetical protein EYF80_019674 [Liparis tanakae]
MWGLSCHSLNQPVVSCSQPFTPVLQAMEIALTWLYLGQSSEVVGQLSNELCEELVRAAGLQRTVELNHQVLGGLHQPGGLQAGSSLSVEAPELDKVPIKGGEVQLVRVYEEEVGLRHTSEHHCGVSGEDEEVICIALQPGPQGDVGSFGVDGVVGPVVVVGLMVGLMVGLAAMADLSLEASEARVAFLNILQAKSHSSTPPKAIALQSVYTVLPKANVFRGVDLLFSTGQRVGGGQGVHGKHLLHVGQYDLVFLQPSRDMIEDMTGSKSRAVSLYVIRPQFSIAPALKATVSGSWMMVTLKTAFMAGSSKQGKVFLAYVACICELKHQKLCIHDKPGLLYGGRGGVTQASQHSMVPIEAREVQLVGVDDEEVRFLHTSDDHR